MSEAFWIFLSSCIGLYLLGLVAASVVHEGGHLLCARVCSIPIGRIVIGGGPVLMRLHVGKVQLEWRLLPVGGLVVPAALPNLQARGPMALFFLGGVLGNVAAIGAIILLHVMGAVPTLLYNDAGTPLIALQAGILTLSQAFFVILCLIPHWAPMDGRPMASDGLQLLRLLQGRLQYAVRLEPYRHGMTRPPKASSASSRIAEQFARTDRLSSTDARRDFWVRLRGELVDSGLPAQDLPAQDLSAQDLPAQDLPAEEEMLVLDALVTDGLLFADPMLLTGLEQWSLRALQLGPGVRTVVGSRGAALVELGRYQEGKALLEAVAFTVDAEPFDALMSRIFLARAEQALGNAAAAAALMTQVRSITAQAGALEPAVISLIERIEREIQCTKSPD